MKPYLSRITFLLAVALLLLPRHSIAATHGWIQPTPAELSMTSIPEVPNASAVILDYDEVDDDVTLHQHGHYARIKILTDEGKKYADVELAYLEATTGSDYFALGYGDIAGRTIHPDGKIIPFTGKPYIKTLISRNGVKVLAKVFTMPDVQVGSIIEYHYTYSYGQNYAEPPDWDIQQDLFIRHAHYRFEASRDALSVGRGDAGNDKLQWVSSLPNGTALKPDPINDGTYDLDLTNIPPLPDEDYMPHNPYKAYHVYFYYFGYKSLNNFWAGEGKYHAKDWDKFIGPDKKVKAATAALISPGDTQTAKLKKIYDAVEAIDNSDFTREHTQQEDKAAGVRHIENTEDILDRKSGDSEDLTELFVAMARAAGFKAYLMAVVNGDKSVFNQNLPSWSQLNAYVAIVNVDGKDQFFDPGSRFCKFGQMSWRHSSVYGVRETDGGDTVIAQTPFMDFRQSFTRRAAVLTLDDKGIATGTLQFAYDGAPALSLRQDALRGDSESFSKDLEKTAVAAMPGGMEIKIKNIANVTNPDLPLVATFTASGPIATVTGKRLIILGDLFAVNAKPLLTQDKRKSDVDFNYTYSNIDAVRITLPPSLTVESLPEKQNLTYKNYAGYSIVGLPLSAGVYQVQRQFALANYYYPVAEYSEAHDFFNKVAQDDQSVVLLKQGTAH